MFFRYENLGKEDILLNLSSRFSDPNLFFDKITSSNKTKKITRARKFPISKKLLNSLENFQNF